LCNQFIPDFFSLDIYIKRKGLPQKSEVAQGVPGRLRPLIFVTFGTTRVVGRQPYTPAAWYSFSDAESTSGHMVLSGGATEKKSLVTPPGVDLETVRLVTQCLNHYATPGPLNESYSVKMYFNHSPFLDSFSCTSQCTL
jgi:hypothetical protein